MKLRRTRHDIDRIAPELLQEIKLLAGLGKTRDAIAKRTGLAWVTVSKVLDKYHLRCHSPKVTRDEIALAMDKYGGLDGLVSELRRQKAEGVGWHKLASITGLNRYACKVLIEEGRVPR